MPVDRTHGSTQPIDAVRIDRTSPWKRKLLQTLRTHYGRTPHFEEIFALVDRCLDGDATFVRDFNLTTIRAFAAALGIDTAKIVCARDLPVEGASTDLLVSLTRAVHGTTYLSGDGAGGYQDADKFKAAGLGIVFQQFKHPVYPQIRDREFVAGLSCIDALMRCGAAETSKFLRQ
jgi:hypothetical protein